MPVSVTTQFAHHTLSAQLRLRGPRIPQLCIWRRLATPLHWELLLRRLRLLVPPPHVSCGTVCGAVMVHVSTDHGRLRRKHTRLRFGHVFGQPSANEHEAGEGGDGAEPVEECFGHGAGRGEVEVRIEAVSGGEGGFDDGTDEERTGDEGEEEYPVLIVFVCSSATWLDWDWEGRDRV